MQFLTDVVVVILTTYLALTNALADGISLLLPEEVPRDTNIALNEDKNAPELSIRTLESEYSNGGLLPDILIKNAAYQNASVIDGVQYKSDTASNVEDALVNIYCTYKTDEYVRTNTGTGFFIDPAGVILTNAHVAQFLLLETVNGTGETECIIRGGNPAIPLYEAELLYISPAWIQKHANLITDESPKGTGERDFALLYVTAGLDNKPMPSQFPYLRVDTELMSTNMMNAEITAAGYPAEGIVTEGPDVDLSPVATKTTITDMFTFVSNYADVFSVANSDVGGRGSSGGPILNEKGDVIGLITTKGSLEEGPNSLRALTLSYIDRTIIEESTFNLERTISGHLAFRSQLFIQTIVPFLSLVLESELE